MLAQPGPASSSTAPACDHCGDPCPQPIASGGEVFCCHGCETVFHLLRDNGLGAYYELEARPGQRQSLTDAERLYAFLDDPALAAPFVQFSDDNLTRVRLKLPQIHCSSCIWLLEHLDRLEPAVTSAHVQFTKREADIAFRTQDLTLKQLAVLLHRIGYPPNFERSTKATKTANKTLLYRLGVAGFCFGNIMLLAFPEYLGMEAEFASFKRFFAWLQLGLSLPVLLYAGWVYLQSAAHALRQRAINMDVPIALGMLTLWIRSAVEIATGTGVGYLDSLAGLVFFLLLGRWFQRKTYDALSFDRDYTAYFPLAVHVVRGAERRVTGIDALQTGDVVELRNTELVPADGILQTSDTYLDYSFVTGESEPVKVAQGSVVYAGGRVQGTSAHVELTQAVDTSYLTQLWNDPAFDAPASSADLQSLSARVGRTFTWVILGITLVTAVVWMLIDPSQAVLTSTAVLIVACPCALALSVPFTYGSLVRFLGKRGLFLKRADVLEALAEVDTVVFDKTGTLTAKGARNARFEGAPLTPHECALVRTAAHQSLHPLSQSISAHLQHTNHLPATDVTEQPGAGIQATVEGTTVHLGHADWVPGASAHDAAQGPRVHVAFDGQFRGTFRFEQTFRPGVSGMLKRLARRAYVLSGDRTPAQVPEALQHIPSEDQQFEASPHDKLAAIRNLQATGAKVIMLGDGLNDAGALRAADVGLAVSEDVGQFTPASAGILQGHRVAELPDYLALAQFARRVIYVSFAVSFAYNVVGLSFAVTGHLSPVVAAILMPISSLSVVVLTTAAIGWRTRTWARGRQRQTG